ncbi:MAG: hypothetical protein K2O00_07890 [Muribaculaceae bacterium]|nr:hypothetical protein [Muribaculaceae bacterium]
MGNILLWIGIAIIVIGWLALAWQASRRMVMKDELEKSPEKKCVMRLRRNYCFLTIFIGAAIIVVAMIC